MPAHHLVIGVSEPRKPEVCLLACLHLAQGHGHLGEGAGGGRQGRCMHLSNLLILAHEVLVEYLEDDSLVSHFGQRQLWSRQQGVEHSEKTHRDPELFIKEGVERVFDYLRLHFLKQIFGDKIRCDSPNLSIGGGQDCNLDIGVSLAYHVKVGQVLQVEQI